MAPDLAVQRGVRQQDGLRAARRAGREADQGRAVCRAQHGQHGCCRRPMLGAAPSWPWCPLLPLRRTAQGDTSAAGCKRSKGAQQVVLDAEHRRAHQRQRCLCLAEAPAQVNGHRYRASSTYCQQSLS